MGLSAISSLGGQSASQENREMIQDQVKANEYLMNQSYKQQEELFKKTYKTVNDKRKEYEEAGMNAALAYGMPAGTGGSTGGGMAQITGATGSNKAQRTSANAAMTGMGISAALVNAQIDLMKSEAEANRADATKKKGVDTEKTQTEIDKLKADTANTNAQTAGQNIENSINAMAATDRVEIINQEANQISETVNKLKRENLIGDETKNAIISEAISKSIQAKLNNELTSANITLTDAQKQALIEGIQQRWSEVGAQWKNADSNAKNALTNEGELKLKKDRPQIGQIGGQIVKKGLNGIFGLLETWDKIQGTTIDEGKAIE